MAVVPNPMPMDVFRLWEKQADRWMYGLPADRGVLIFGAMGTPRSPGKGWTYLREALKSLWRMNSGAVAAFVVPSGA